ncbi:MAG: hypothetical protein Q7T83_09595 [Thermodesulfovibrionales bacterium]|nr:hypothetical protein [Thermodesulfovibrionales bacterium]MDP3111340.1 hypothetical protein [Thermodesulfovibrionales bacterium]
MTNLLYWVEGWLEIIRHGGEKMAKQIKETPILSGRNAERFTKIIEKNKEKQASKSEYDRVMNNYNKLKAKLKLD